MEAHTFIHAARSAGRGRDRQGYKTLWLVPCPFMGQDSQADNSPLSVRSKGWSEVVHWSTVTGKLLPYSCSPHLPISSIQDPHPKKMGRGMYLRSHQGE